MKTHRTVLAVSLAAMVGGMLAPVVAPANPGWQGGPRPPGGQHPPGGRVVMGPGPSHVPPHGQFHRPFVPRVYPRFPYRSSSFFGAGFYAPPIVYGSSLDYGSSAGYDPPLMYSAPPAPAPITMFVAAPARPGVIEYPAGRFELRGDGFSTPYVWVWIPNPPPPPPSAPDGPTATRAEPPAPPRPSDPPSPRRSQLYRWVDEQGVIHLTDNPESVPAQYRKPAARAQGGAS